jgi:hypothetical protein
MLKSLSIYSTWSASDAQRTAEPNVLDGEDGGNDRKPGFPFSRTRSSLTNARCEMAAILRSSVERATCAQDPRGPVVPTTFPWRSNQVSWEKIP